MAEMMQDLPALNNFSDFEQEYEIVQIQEHPLHGLFSVEVPVNYTDDEVRSYVNTLDLDLLLGSDNKQPLAGSSGEDTFNTEQLKEFENSVGAGKRGEKWFKFSSLEGGTDSIAYGHKLTSSEAESGLIKIGNDEVDYRKGLTEDQAQALLNQDVTLARKFAMASLVKVGLEGDDNKVQALTSLIYNVGSGAWSNSKAKKYLESGRVEDFMYEAFSEEVGFVKIGEDKSRGLVRRRAAEAQLFAQSNLSETNSFGNMMKDVLKKINPISSAVAAEVTPQQQEPKLGGLTPPRKPMIVKVQDKTILADAVTSAVGAGIIPSEYRAFLSDIFGVDDGKLRDANYFSQDELTALRGVVKKAHSRLGGTEGDIDYDKDYVGGQSTVRSSRWDIFSGGAEESIKKTIGDMTWKIKDGRVIVEDMYDFNDALPEDTPWYKRMEHVAKWGAAMAAGKSGLYGFLRFGIGSAYGSRPGEGAAFLIDLGTVEEVLGSKQDE